MIYILFPCVSLINQQNYCIIFFVSDCPTHSLIERFKRLHSIPFFSLLPGTVVLKISHFLNHSWVFEWQKWNTYNYQAATQLTSKIYPLRKSASDHNEQKRSILGNLTLIIWVNVINWSPFCFKIHFLL